MHGPDRDDPEPLLGLQGVQEPHRVFVTDPETFGTDEVIWIDAEGMCSLEAWR